ncbi:DUF1294 domain-containing protein [Desulfoluna spongiiphila]|uniref:Uncharacterized membrane protein YsdA, DUF1294 family n=1 Tax=Desulfoluna spongiiphila TaxID=419481 RepID=A0A1G5ILU1_9BACT|nr:DUF1294 domain-containing protein [Desulfoluna spongiiphila]SCY76711.1 Uncharacterized membrane protein YsdA, DUF1294 family [Desulfoluna spongiiphila]VVS90969.1 prokaryotic membrane lipoprotein lipid attachment site profile [Desulfoluna spongiiphila]
METLRTTTAAAFLLGISLAACLGSAPIATAAVYLGASCATFLAYALDKSAAKHGKWRTQEKTLHLLALAGGWPGAIIAQQSLRHKTRKKTFRALFWLTVTLNCCGLFLYLKPETIQQTALCLERYLKS